MKEQQTRRRIIKTLAAGAGAAVWHSAIPDRWVTPIIESIALLAHAQTSVPAELSAPQCTDLVIRQVEGHSGTTDLTVSASRQFRRPMSGSSSM